jgi:uncharacterized GH25 family protein
VVSIERAAIIGAIEGFAARSLSRQGVPVSHSLFAVTVVSLSIGASLAAHDFWIEPSSFSPDVGAVVRVSLRVGQDFAGDPVPRNAPAIASFFLVGPDGQQDVLGRDGMDPAGLFRVATAGTVLVGYRSHPSPVTLDAAKFEQYLKEEGLEHVIAARAKAGVSQAPGREIFSRSVKALLRAGNPGTNGYDRVLGLTLELIPERDPAALPADGRLPVRVLYGGKELSGVLVTAISRDKRRVSARSDANGRAVLTVGSGEWLVKTVHMVEAPPNSGADWESIWASLTFDARPGSPTKITARR